MKSKVSMVVMMCLIAGASPAQEETAPALELGTVATREGQGPSLAEGFAPALDSITQQQRLAQAYAHMQNFDYTEARALFGEVLAESPGNRQALSGLSVIHTKTHEYAEALRILEALMVREPGDVSLKNNAAWIYATADDLAIRDGHRAVELAREALVSAPGLYHVWSTMAEGYYITGQFKQAQTAAEEALRMGIRAKADSDNMREYRSQVSKTRLAVAALSLVE